MRFSLPAACLLLLAASTASAFADGIGTVVSGDMDIPSLGNYNFFDSANQEVPAGYGNSSGSTSVIIGPEIEFGFFAGAGSSKTTISADFTGDTLTLTQVGTSTVAIDYSFSDTAFTGFSLVSNTFGDTYSFSGDTLEIMQPGNSYSGTNSIVFDYTTNSVSPVPEPGSVALLGTGALGLLGTIRRRIRR